MSGATTTPSPVAQAMGAKAGRERLAVCHLLAEGIRTGSSHIRRSPFQVKSLSAMDKLIERRLTGPDAWRDLVEVDDFVHLANSIANRRKSRAGSSLENQLKAVFDTFSLAYTFQARTEGRKRPDFLFPSEGSYHDPDFPTDGLTMLASKTTCKDRWRQVINEADRLRDSWKYLFTLQQGVSANQLREMEGERVRLVAPRGNLKYFAAEMRPMVRTLGYFTELVSSRQERLIRDGHPIP